MVWKATGLYSNLCGCRVVQGENNFSKFYSFQNSIPPTLYNPFPSHIISFLIQSFQFYITSTERNASRIIPSVAIESSWWCGFLGNFEVTGLTFELIIGQKEWNDWRLRMYNVIGRRPTARFVHSSWLSEPEKLTDSEIINFNPGDSRFSSLRVNTNPRGVHDAL